jgi:hypothetical protein
MMGTTNPVVWVSKCFQYRALRTRRSSGSAIFSFFSLLGSSEALEALRLVAVVPPFFFGFTSHCFGTDVFKYIVSSAHTLKID